MIDQNGTTVVKIGGTEGVERGSVLNGIAARVENGEPLVVVHGGSGAVDELHDRLGVEPTYVESPSGMKGRFTDDETMEIFKMAMAGKVNTDIVEELQTRGVDAVGLTGVDGRLLEGEHKDKVIAVEDGRKKVKRGDRSGKIEEVNDELLELLIGAGYVPVVGVPMVSYDGTAVNTDADRSAAEVAGALGARLVILSDVPGLLRDPDDTDSLVEKVGYDGIDDVIDEYAEGKMKKKVYAAREALDAGARSVVLASANVDEAVARALNGEGTVFGSEGEE
ncbi:acetylglutamate/acetylaminoadipate kinase [Haladaptatus sp. F3-133]|jgi:acetylglutamate/LysW-gamma-L-alpha-aminoadipate kinase|uniref:Putative [LysW]-aminoadipate/[LysW]-glutamate kinase n=1 Tax=Halorutilus salinus TaxID=2487751 RepID=A0A9Q4C597_9EURY|nr:acetylglutamate/acetylaminoadipate kinase [Halorutilus salinus]MCX2819194.1 acetylglutamate/acetylaminoadipate kinase [Halorutilus salinus]